MTDQYQVKQVIVLRSDLQMPSGKACAQASHASHNALVNTLHSNPFFNNMNYRLWMKQGYAKIVLRAKSEAELNKVYDKCIEAGIPFVSKVVDEGRTVFNSQPTVTAMCAGPWDVNILDPIFKRLQLYNV